MSSFASQVLNSAFWSLRHLEQEFGSRNPTVLAAKRIVLSNLAHVHLIPTPTEGALLASLVQSAEVLPTPATKRRRKHSL
jgi:hypothetical protein